VNSAEFMNDYEPFKRTDGMHELHNATLTWLGANGIDSKNIPMGKPMSYADGKLTCRVYMLDENGRTINCDPTTPHDRPELVTVTRTFDIAIEPPDDVAEWLLPKCETCGR